jgi:hypothetical protein
MGFHYLHYFWKATLHTVLVRNNQIKSNIDSNIFQLFCVLLLLTGVCTQWCEHKKLTYVKFWRNVIRNANFCNFLTFTLTWRIFYFLLTFYVYVWRKFKFSCLFEHVIFQFCETFLRVWKIVCFPRFYSFSSQYCQTLVLMKFLVTVNRFF